MLPVLLEEDLLHDAETQVEAIHQPQGVVDDGGGEAIPSVPFWVGQVSGHCLEPTRSSPS
ncbi:MAG: hypothetical protein HC933_15150 [Pleurocapsa sp. SU_196_0]|nr:hypothetical protein [Pleurocapsa sp. SU_196_0]